LTGAHHANKEHADKARIKLRLAHMQKTCGVTDAHQPGLAKAHSNVDCQSARGDGTGTVNTSFMQSRKLCRSALAWYNKALKLTLCHI